MTEATYNFLVDTLYEEVMMHPNREEIVTLAYAQLLDDAEYACTKEVFTLIAA